MSQLRRAYEDAGLPPAGESEKPTISSLSVCLSDTGLPSALGPNRGQKTGDCQSPFGYTRRLALISTIEEASLVKVNRRLLILHFVAVLALFFHAASASAWVLIADRLTNRVLKYTDSGQFLNVVVEDPVNLGGVGNASGPNALALRGDANQLWVSSLNGSVVRYDFNGFTASNPLKITSNGASTINDPGGVILTPDGATVYVSSRGFGFSDVVARLNPDGTSQGADLGGGGFTGRTGLAFQPGGDLLAGVFGSDFMGGGPGGGVVRLEGGAMVPFIANSQSISGVASLLVNGNDLYLTASVGPDFQGRIAKFNATTGAPDAAFGTGGLITPGVSFPAGLSATSDGTGFLVSMLHLTDNGAGRVDRYLFDGTYQGVWANNSNANPALGFREATALIRLVPEPNTLAGSALLAVGWAIRRRVWWRR
jgi:hypothetical protein